MKLFPLLIFLSGCLKTEYPDERPCQHWDYDYEVSQDHVHNKETFALFSERGNDSMDLGRYFAPTLPSKIKWSFNDNLIFDGSNFPLEYSEDEFRWLVKGSDGSPIGRFTLLTNTMCWGEYELELDMESGELGKGTLSW